MIIHYCRVANQSISIDGKELFRKNSGSLDVFFEEAYRVLNIDYPKFYKMDNLCKAGFIASEMLLKDRGHVGQRKPEDISVVLSSANGCLETDMRYERSRKNIASPGVFVYTLPNIVAGEICIRHKIKGENAFFISSAFDPVLLQSYVSLVHTTNLCLAGWVDVMDAHHDVFLYLLDKTDAGLPHTPSTLKELYQK